MRTVVAALLGLAVLALGVTVWTSWAGLGAARDADATGEAAAQAVAAARAIAPDLLSYDHRTVEQDLARAAGHTTGALTGRYRQLAGTLAPRAKAQKTVQTASVVAAAVERAEPGRVEVLLFVNTGTVKELPGEAEPQRQIARNRARLVMVRHDSRWLAADLSTLIGGA